MRERVRYLNGTIDVQSNANGTKISVTLPAAVPSEGQKLESSSASG
jgi:signal transduction histidine kinase